MHKYSPTHHIISTDTRYIILISTSTPLLDTKISAQCFIIKKIAVLTKLDFKTHELKSVIPHDKNIPYMFRGFILAIITVYFFFFHIEMPLFFNLIVFGQVSEF